MKVLVFLLLGICCYTDLKKRVVSMKILLIFLLISLLWMIVFRQFSVGSMIKSPLLGIVLLICSKLLKGAVGEGDAYLTMLTGVMLGGENNLRLLLVALLLSALCALFLVLVKKKEKTVTFPFVPFLFLSYVLTFIMIPFAGWKFWL